MKNLLDHLSFRTRCGICLILFSILLIACDSDDTPSQESLLPPITMTGENTFGCLIDGKFFKPRDGSNLISSGNKGMRTRVSELVNTEIEVNDFKSEKIGNLILDLENLRLNGTGIYQIDRSNSLRGLDGENNTYMHCRIWSNKTDSYEGYVSYDNSGEIEILKSEPAPSIGFIYSGTFKGKLVNFNNRLDTIKITLGRFDIDTVTLSTTSFN
ncbi:hypothetical protein LX97_01062 [Nonlabens dokdonensis]|uniref:Secreted protein n=2 Tax=Nonlabens dokdonensis TaxID=328515 RepID=L7W9A0_NONDD|nr:hypothetical protein [Nonlabens dokdonensis]AGC76396.1 hypothetical protein DDD_1269 [Nonlabens dokdonensis DSW-6]PZX44054.1 hypothetical protein LX97_01062 [Nonlabens dokdonensis]